MSDMFQTTTYSGDRVKDYELVIQQLNALLEGEKNITANLANTAALVNQFLDDINWVGFYIGDEKDNERILGPFQGLPAGIRIPYGHVVCGTAANQLTTELVPALDHSPA